MSYTSNEFTVDEVGFIQVAMTKVLAAVARGELDLNRLAREELAARGLDDKAAHLAPLPIVSRQVLRSWQRLAIACQLRGSQKSAISPRCGITWSTTVATVSTLRPSSQSGHWQSGCARRNPLLVACHRRP